MEVEIYESNLPSENKILFSKISRQLNCYIYKSYLKYLEQRNFQNNLITLNKDSLLWIQVIHVHCHSCLKNISLCAIHFKTKQHYKVITVLRSLSNFSNVACLHVYLLIQVTANLSINCFNNLTSNLTSHLTKAINTWSWASGILTITQSWINMFMTWFESSPFTHRLFLLSCMSCNVVVQGTPRYM